MQLTARAYEIPTDAPEGDGTIAWSSTTLVLVEASADRVVGIGRAVGPADADYAVGACLDQHEGRARPGDGAVALRRVGRYLVGPCGQLHPLAPPSPARDVGGESPDGSRA